MTNETNLSELQPQPVWENFAKICQIPHPSKHEQKLVAFIQTFAQQHNLESIIDDVGNIIVRKPATPGMEQHKGVILQAHLDMVPQKDSNVTHDFLIDPIQPYIDGEWVTAKGTTLGADNGLGVAAILAVLQATDITHGPLEALFTIDEETGMTGAEGLKPAVLKGAVLLNLDSETEGELYIGCAGGINTEARLMYSTSGLPKNVSAFNIHLSGLRGGHSGMDINLGRGNANKILARLLWQASQEYQLGLATFNGGDLRNAIPREAVATVTVPQDQATLLLNFVKEFMATVKHELATTDPDLTITVLDTDLPNSLVDGDTQNKLLSALCCCADGVLGMSADIPDLVITSTNLGKVSVENGVIDILTLQRSSLDSLKMLAAHMVGCAFSLVGAQITYSGSYPGWQPKLDSPILKLMQETYQTTFKKKPKVAAVHAGLECGLLAHTYPQLDMISFGPTIKHPHSPTEKANIKSVTEFWDLLKAVLKNI